MPGIRPGMTTERLALRRFWQRGLGLFDDDLEGRRLHDRELRHHLAVDGDAGLSESVDEFRVVQPERPHRGIDALDPERAEAALLVLAVAVGVLHRLFHRLLGDADGVAATAVVALGRLVDLLVLGVRSDAAFAASHGGSPEMLCLSRWAGMAA